MIDNNRNETKMHPIFEHIKESCKRVLLLQGPRGLFFTKFGKYLKKQGIAVYKINFNGGDEIFYPLPNAYSFRGKPAEWESFISDFLKEKDIDTIFLFGDCRYYHQVAIKVAKNHNISVYVFEEGYVRPDYITLEKNGANAYSTLPRDSSFYMSLPELTEVEEHRPLPANMSFLSLVISASIYHLFELIMRWKYPHYRYHKHFSFFTEPFYWIRSVFRKFIYKIQEKPIAEKLFNECKKKYFLVPLQFFRDSQILIHSPYKTIVYFIEEVIKSFAKNAQQEHLLVFKHHPIDRGHVNYKKDIDLIARQYGFNERVLYVHDIYLPKLLENSLGTVVINSTVGMTSLDKGIPVKVLGTAIYDIPGITFQGSLDDFWKNPGKVDNRLFKRFKWYVITHTQLNGNFYGRWPFD